MNKALVLLLGLSLLGSGPTHALVRQLGWIASGQTVDLYRSFPVVYDLNGTPIPQPFEDIYTFDTGGPFFGATITSLALGGQSATQLTSRLTSARGILPPTVSFRSYQLLLQPVGRSRSLRKGSMLLI
jgi:hypothetical protein